MVNGKSSFLCNYVLRISKPMKYWTFVTYIHSWSSNQNKYNIGRRIHCDEGDFLLVTWSNLNCRSRSKMLHTIFPNPKKESRKSILQVVLRTWNSMKKLMLELPSTILGQEICRRLASHGSRTEDPTSIYRIFRGQNGNYTTNIE